MDIIEQSKSYINEDGDKTWYLPSKGKYYYHRLDGPAIEIESGRTKYWYVDDKIHRLDCPAVERANGTKEWGVNDKKLPTEE